MTASEQIELLSRCKASYPEMEPRPFRVELASSDSLMTKESLSALAEFVDRLRDFVAATSLSTRTLAVRPNDGSCEAIRQVAHQRRSRLQSAGHWAAVGSGCCPTTGEGDLDCNDRRSSRVRAADGDHQTGLACSSIRVSRSRQISRPQHSCWVPEWLCEQPWCPRP